MTEEGERRYRQLVRTSPAPINLFDASGEIIWGNDAVLDLLGLEGRDELVGRSIFEFVHPADRETAKAELQAVVEEKESIGPTAMRLTRADGEERKISVATAPGQYQGEDIGQAIVVDVTELDAMRDELRLERVFIDTALDTLEDVFYVINPGGSLVRWNDALLEVSGYTASAVQSMDVEEFFVDDHADRISESISRAFVSGADTTEAVVETRTGERIPYEFRKRRLDREGSVIALVGLGRDITDRRTREQHLRTVDYLLQHHLRNQLNVIQGNAVLLADDHDEADASRVEDIDAAVDTMLSLFDHHRSIVEYLLTKTGRERADVVAMLDSLVEELRTSHPDADVHLTGPESAPVVAAPEIRHAFQELVWNAIEHNDDPHPRVTITVDAEASPVEIRIEDDGPRMSRNEYEFLEAPDGIDSTTHPTGLGLWSVHLAVEYSRGTMRVEEAPDGGNAIVVELPAPVDDWTG